MALYWSDHLMKLHSELVSRYSNLELLLQVDRRRLTNVKIPVNGTNIRLAVDDFKSILAEIRKLK